MCEKSAEIVFSKVNEKKNKKKKQEMKASLA